MLLFRDEEHVDRWTRASGIARGESLSVEQGWQLARELYADRRAFDWRRKTPSEYEAMFQRAGLTSDFWRLQP
jgi:hypothetical protein